MNPEPANCDLTAVPLVDCVRDFQLYGFTVLRQFYSGGDVARIREQLDDYMVNRLTGLPDDAVIRSKNGAAKIVILAKLDRHDEFFARLKADERLRATARQLLNADTEPLHVDFINKHRHAPVTRPHQDAYIFTRWPAESLTFWIALDDIDAENGCLCYVRGSHWHGYRLHDRRPGPNQILNYTEQDRTCETAVRVQPGDVAVHHSFTVHRSEPNRSGRPRWALAIPFVRSDSRVIPKAEWLARHEERRR